MGTPNRQIEKLTILNQTGGKMRIRNQAGRLAMSLALVLAVVGPAFAKHDHEVNLDQGVTIDGKQLTPGKYKVSWETHSPQATVTFMQKKTVVATASGTLVERPTAYEYDSIVYSKESDNGPTTILEIRFAGSNKVLTFGPSSPSSSLAAPKAKHTVSAKNWKAPSTTSRQAYNVPASNAFRAWDLDFNLMTYGNRLPDAAPSGASAGAPGRTLITR
jgi:hypothetical protein